MSVKAIFLVVLIVCVGCGLEEKLPREAELKLELTQDLVADAAKAAEVKGRIFWQLTRIKAPGREVWVSQGAAASGNVVSLAGFDWDGLAPQNEVEILIKLWLRDADGKSSVRAGLQGVRKYKVEKISQGGQLDPPIQLEKVD